MSKRRGISMAQKAVSAKKPAVKSETATPMQRIHPDSMLQKLLELEPGESESRSVRIAGETATAEAVREAISKFHRNYSTTVKRAKDRDPDREYKSATGEFRARDGDIIVTISITRES